MTVPSPPARPGWLWSVLTVLVSVSGVADTDVAIPDPEAWYVNEYAPVWAVASAQTASASAPFYAEQILVFGQEAPTQRQQNRAWLDEVVAAWIEEGWLGSELPNVVTDRINASTASFKARYLDRYGSAESSYSCGWYLARYDGAAWAFTAFAEIECESVEWESPE